MKRQLSTALGIAAGVILSQFIRANLFREKAAPKKQLTSSNLVRVMDQKTKDSFSVWGDRECVENMINKTGNDPRFLRARDQIGDAYPAFVKSVMRPSMQLYCKCAAASIISGDSMSQSMRTCQPIMDREIRTRMDAFVEGYR